jgi:acyl carrier protein
LVPADAEMLAERWARERLVGDLREALSSHLPDYMVPVAWVALPSLPLSPNGKLDRGRLPAPDLAEGLATQVPPRTPAEELLAGIWCDVLGAERIGVHTSFFDLGGHSLLATQVMSRLRDAFGVDLPLRRLFEMPTIAELARTIESLLAGGGAAAAAIPQVSRDQPLPLSFSQERLWVLDRLQSGDTAYNLPLTLFVEGRLAVPVLAAAFGEIVRRHESLRTIFAERDGEPVQVILPPELHPPALPTLPTVDLQGLAAPVRERETRRLAAAEAGRSFDLAQGPLLRTLLLRRQAGEHLLLVHMHHIVSDVWSMGVLVHEVEVLYAAFQAGHSLPLP